MAKRDENVFEVEASADALLQLLIDPKFHEMRAKKIQDALEARVEEHERSDERFKFTVHSKEYAKGITGVDKSKTEQAETDYDWDLAAKKAEWIYRGAQGALAKVWGSIRIEPVGDKARLVSDFNVQIKIPLVGGKLEKMVITQVKKSWEPYEKLVNEMLKANA